MARSISRITEKLTKILQENIEAQTRCHKDLIKLIDLRGDNFNKQPFLWKCSDEGDQYHKTTEDLETEAEAIKCSIKSLEILLQKTKRCFN